MDRRPARRARPAAVPVIGVALVAFGSVAGVRASTPEDRPSVPVIAIAGTPGGTGEIAVLDRRGEILRRITGLDDPVDLTPGRDGFLVTEGDARRVVEVAIDGRVLWSTSLPAALPRLASAAALPSGNVLIAASEAGALEVDRTGTMVWQVASPLPGVPVRSAVRLADGTTVLVLPGRHGTVWAVRPGGTSAEPVDLAVEPGARNLPRGAAWPGMPDAFVASDTDWAATYLATLRGRSVTSVKAVPVARVYRLTPDRAGGFVYVTDDFWVRHWTPAGEAFAYQSLFEPTGVAVAPDGSAYLIAYTRLADGSWPDSKPRPAAQPTIDWRRFLGWVAAGALLVAGMHVAARRRFRRRPTPRPAIDPPADADAAAPAAVPPHPWTLGRVAATVAVVAGLAGAGVGHRFMTQGFRPGWLVLFGGGALLVAAALEAWRRVGRGDVDGFWRAAQAARPRLGATSLVLLAEAVTMLGCLALFFWRWRRIAYSDQVGLWVALLLLQIGLALLPTGPPAAAGRRRHPGRWLLPAIPVAVAAVTMGYRLPDLPTYMHFDYVFNATSAWDVMLGRKASIWDSGFVPAPVIGLVPEVVGLALAGPGELGFRLGGALFGLTGIVAVYILGACYRDRRTGLLAALFLAGSVPFVHFSRTNANGDAATAGLWTLTFFALALKRGRPGYWIASGLAAGYCFYLWPGARVAVLACVAAGTLLAGRSPAAARRRWFGPVLAAVAFAVFIVPMIPSWLVDRNLAMPRVRESFEVYKPEEGIRWDVLRSSFKEPLANSLGWFFVVPDNSTQGTLSPGCNAVEAVLLAIGLAIVLGEGFSLNVLFVAQIAFVLLALGAWGGSPPWYTRLVPTSPVAAVLMARVVGAALDLIAPGSPRRRRALFAAACLGVVVLVPAANLRTYVRHEAGKGDRVPAMAEMVAIGRRFRDLGPGYRFYLVTTRRPDWNVDLRRPNGRLGELLPFIWNLDVREIRDLESSLPLAPGPPAVIAVQAARFAADTALLARVYPQAKVERLLGYNGELVAGLVLVP